MFWRSLTLGGLAWLALSAAVCSNGEETTADLSNSNERVGDKQAADDNEAIEIPLSEIWAYDMPGTQDVRQLEDQEKFKGMLVTERIKNSVVSNTHWRLNLNFRPSEGNHADRGFVVTGVGLDALKEANAILSGKKNREDFFAAGEELTLVFFAYSCSRFVRLDEVMRTHDEIVVKYHFHSHGLRKSSQHFALIPLGSSLRGNINVKMKRMADTTSINKIDPQAAPYDQGEARRIVCEPFAFGIIDPKN